MQVTYASEAAPGGINEDFIVAGLDWVVVLDGATPRPGVASGCIHTVPWLVQRLGTHLATTLTLVPDIPLDDALAEAIRDTCKQHADTCDLDNPDSPSSTVAIVRVRDGRLDHLVLGDSPILLQSKADHLQVVTDERSAHLPSYTAEGVRAARNQPGGFWIASTRAEAAHHAVIGNTPVSELAAAAVMTDGVTRAVERVGLMTWESLFVTLVKEGPQSVIDRVRAAEREQLPPMSQEASGRRVKRHDDATAALVYGLT